jgi:hydrogenase 3 maturation protease
MHKINYKEFLEALKGRVKGKVVLVGIGNELRGDDGFGPYVVEALKGKVSAALINCGTALENYHKPIVKDDPDAIILLDIAAFEGPYGEIAVFEKRDIMKIGFSTHNVSPKVFIEMLERSVKADILMVGVKPKGTAFGEELSEEVREAADMLAGFFEKLLGTGGKEV